MSRLAPQISLPWLWLRYFSTQVLGKWLKRPTTLAFFAIWLVVLSVPTTRRLLKIQVFGGTGWNRLVSWSSWWSSEESSSWRAFARQYPDNLDVQSQTPFFIHNDEFEALVSGTWISNVTYVDPQPLSPGGRRLPTAPLKRQALDAFDRVIERWPDRPWLLAMRIAHTLQLMQDDRMAGNLEWPENERKVAPERTVQMPNFSTQDWQKAVAIARRGQILEPHNNYWDWALAILMYANYRDADAFVAISQGAQKSFFDDHESTYLQARLRTIKLMRPLFIEEKWQINIGWSLVPLENFARDVAWQAVKLERDGQFRRAILLRRDLMRLSRPLAQPPNSEYDARSMFSIMQRAWRQIPPEERRKVKRRKGVPLWEAEAADFAAYARDHRQASVGTEAIALSRQATRLHRFFQSPQFMETQKGVARRDMARLSTMFYGSVFCLWQLAALPVLWLNLSVLLRRSQPGDEQPVITHKVLWCLIVSMISLALTALWCNVGVITISAFDGFNWQPGPERETRILFAGFIAACLFFWAPALLGALYSWGAMAWQIWRERTIWLAPLPPKYDGISATIVPPNPVPTALAWATFMVVGTTVLLWVLAIIGGLTGATVWQVPFAWASEDIWMPFRDPGIVCAILAFWLSLFCWFVWPIKWRFGSTPRWRPLGHRALHRYRALLGYSFLVCSTFYLIFTFASLPIRRQIDADYLRYLQQGDLVNIPPARPR